MQSQSRPAQIRATHLARTAVVYVRQSSAVQVKRNTGSTDYQRNQERIARAWGWKIVEVVDDDLGMSGSSAGHRHGYLEVRRQIEAGEIGLLMVSDMTRAGRDATEWLALIKSLEVHDVLLAVDGVLQDLRDQSAKLTAQLLSVIGEHENTMRRATMRRGLEAKLGMGKAVTSPPTGYVCIGEAGKKAWGKDPYPGVQEAIAAVFRAFRSAPSCKQTLIALKANGVRVPVRKGQVIEWRQPTVQSVYRILTNPAFAGVYRFGRRVSDPKLGRDARGRVRHRLRAADEITLIPDHHEPYVPWEEFENIQATLVLNGASGSRRNLAGGPALCQGVIHCAAHGHRLMSATYKQPRHDGSMPHYYQCAGDYASGGEQCGRLIGERVDTEVLTALLDRLAAPRMETVVEALRVALSDRSRESSRQRLELQRARLEADTIESRFLQLDPSSQEVLKALERKWEEARRRVAHLERLSGTAPDSDAPTEQMLTDLEALCRDLPAIWNAPTTTTKDRKQLIRLMIRDIVLEYRDEERVQLRIAWADGEDDTIVGYPLRGHTVRLVLEMADDGMAPAQIAERLNELGIRTAQGAKWTRHTIAHKLKRLLSERDSAIAERRAEQR